CDTGDKAAGTCGSTTANGALQDLSLGTLNVGSTAGFNTTGSFTVDGITGVCSYTGTTGTSFTGITGCTGKPANGAAVGGGLYWVKKISPGVYQVYGNPNLTGSAISLSGGSGENHRLVPTDQAGVRQDTSPRFSPADDVTGNTINLPYSAG